MRSRFDEELLELSRELVHMGSLCEEAISSAMETLHHGSAETVKRVSAKEREIDDKERVIEALCLKLLLRRQPVARDLRQISAALKMITDMERIGDQAADIAEISVFMEREGSQGFELISEMALAAAGMVTGSVDAYIKRDTELAKSVIARDDVVDACFYEIKSKLIADIAASPADGGFALDLLMVAKYFERIGDHAVNLAEWVIYALTGIHKDEPGL